MPEFGISKELLFQPAVTAARQRLATISPDGAICGSDPSKNLRHGWPAMTRRTAHPGHTNGGKE